MTNRTRTALAPWVATAALFLIWELGCWLLAIPEFILPTPSASLAALWQFAGAIWFNAVFTLWVTLLGFAIAVAFGLVLGVLIGASPLAYAALNPLLIGFNSIPKVAIVPVLVIWFGIGAVPAVLTAFLISFFPIVVNVATGIATLEPELKDVLRSLGARPIDILLKVGLPRAMPYFFASLKVAVTLAFVGSVISETIAGNRGIGYLMLQASSSFRVPLVFAGLIVVALMGILMYAAFAVLERRVTGWAFRGSQPAG
ncbi:MAG TPA: ABC transporter permease [Geminicoccaceae bacterium]|nr:ABC transporter permease [Geminicoccus sp.]HMU52398.1 ABC transporter permease [Geminicoccaceae bacterium]